MAGSGTWMPEDEYLNGIANAARQATQPLVDSLQASIDSLRGKVQQRVDKAAQTAMDTIAGAAQAAQSMQAPAMPTLSDYLGAYGRTTEPSAAPATTAPAAAGATPGDNGLPDLDELIAGATSLNQIATGGQGATRPGGQANMGGSMPAIPEGVAGGNKDQLLRTLAPYAKIAAARTGLPAELFLAVPLNEQGIKGWPHNNGYGIKGKNPRTGASFMSPTWEVYNGKKVQIDDEFRAYDSPDESMADFADFLASNSRYRSALQDYARHRDPHLLVQGIHAAGYATDPNWSRQVGALLDEARPYIQGVESRQEGGLIDEPVVGLGLNTGKQYTFGEAGPEAVSPLSVGSVQDDLLAGAPPSQPEPSPEPPRSPRGPILTDVAPPSTTQYDTIANERAYDPRRESADPDVAALQRRIDEPRLSPMRVPQDLADKAASLLDAVGLTGEADSVRSTGGQTPWDVLMRALDAVNEATAPYDPIRTSLREASGLDVIASRDPGGEQEIRSMIRSARAEPDPERRAEQAQVVMDRMEQHTRRLYGANTDRRSLEGVAMEAGKNTGGDIAGQLASGAIAAAVAPSLALNKGSLIRNVAASVLDPTTLPLNAVADAPRLAEAAASGISAGARRLSEVGPETVRPLGDLARSVIEDAGRAVDRAADMIAPRQASYENVVPIDRAKDLDVPVGEPPPPLVRQAVEAAGGHYEADGTLTFGSVRYQQPSQQGRPARRGAVHTAMEPPGTETWYRREEGPEKSDVGGSQAIDMPTMTRNPLYVTIDALAELPEFIKPGGSQHSLMGVIDQYGGRPLAEAVAEAWGDMVWGRERLNPDRAREIANLMPRGTKADVVDALSSLGRMPPHEHKFALVEAVASALARANGHDSIIQLRHAGDGTPLAVREVLDLRARDYPYEGFGSPVRRQYKRSEGTELSPGQASYRDLHAVALREIPQAERWARRLDGTAYGDRYAVDGARAVTEALNRLSDTIEAAPEGVPAGRILQNAVRAWDDVAQSVYATADAPEVIVPMEAAMNRAAELMRRNPQPPTFRAEGIRRAQSEMGGTAADAAEATIPGRQAVGALVGGIPGGAAGGVAGDASASEDAGMGEVFARTGAGTAIGMAAGALAGRQAAKVATRSAARLLDSLIARGAVDATVLASHPLNIDRARAMLLAAAEGLPDNAVVQPPPQIAALAKLAGGGMTAEVMEPRTAGQIRSAYEQPGVLARLADSMSEILADAITGLGARHSRSRENAADLATVRGLTDSERARVRSDGRPLFSGATSHQDYGEIIPSEDPDVLGLVRSVADELGVPAPAVAISERGGMSMATMPGTRPTLILPRSLTQAGLTEDEMRAALTHEIAHSVADPTMAQRLAGWLRGEGGGIDRRGMVGVDAARHINPEPAAQDLAPGVAEAITAAGGRIEDDGMIVLPVQRHQKPYLPGQQAPRGMVFYETPRGDLANAAQGALVGAASEDVQAQQEGREPDQAARLGRAALGALGGVAAGRGARPVARGVAQAGSGFVGRISDPGAQRTVQKIETMYGAKARQPVADDLDPGKMETFRRFMVRQLTDRVVDVAEMQKLARRSLGRELRPTEMLTELLRTSEAWPAAARQRIDEMLRPIAQDLPTDSEDYQYVRTYLTLLDNVDVGKAFAGRAQESILSRETPTVATPRGAQRAADIAVEDARRAGNAADAAAAAEARGAPVTEVRAGPSRAARDEVVRTRTLAEERGVEADRALRESARAGGRTAEPVQAPPAMSIHDEAVRAMADAERLGNEADAAGADLAAAIERGGGSAETAPKRKLLTRAQMREQRAAEKAGRALSAEAESAAVRGERATAAAQRQLDRSAADLREAALSARDREQDAIRRAGDALTAAEESAVVESQRATLRRHRERLDALAEVSRRRASDAYRAEQRAGEKLTAAENARYLRQVAAEDRQLMRGAAAYEQQYEGRMFSGGVTAPESESALEALKAAGTPEQAAKAQATNQAMVRLIGNYRDRLVEAGYWSQEAADRMAADYPNYIPTRILDYLSASSDLRAGKTAAGTDKARLDPMAAMIQYIRDSEKVIARQRAFGAFVELWSESPEMQRLFTPIPASMKLRNDQKTIGGFVNGAEVRFMTDHEVGHRFIAAFNGEPARTNGGWRAIALAVDVMKELITRSPAFGAKQLIADGAGFLINETAHQGGPQNLPKVIAALADGYRDAFSGILSGQFTGDGAALFMREGGGMSAWTDRSEKALRRSAEDLRRHHVFEVNSPKDLARMFRQVITLEPFQAINQRIELAPRIAAMKLDLARGRSLPEAVVHGRDVTTDFMRAGLFVRTLNQVLMFLNPAVQGSVYVGRRAKENPAAFLASAAMGLIGPTLITEAWNRMTSTPEEIKDVARGAQDRGLYFRVPWLDGRDARGDKRPFWAHIPTREYSPFVMVTREALRQALGEKPRDWLEFSLALGGALSPLQAQNAGDAALTVVPPIADTALQLYADRDLFRDQQIATERNDEDASALAKGVAAGATGVLRRAGSARTVRPSQVQFAMANSGQFAGRALGGASDLIAGRPPKEKRLANVPVLGGLAPAIGFDVVGQNLRDTQERQMTRGVIRLLDSAGIRPDSVSTIPASLTIKGQRYSLSRVEQRAIQAQFNQHLAQELFNASTDSDWADPETREKAARRAISEARAKAYDEGLAALGITRSDIDDRAPVGAGR